MKNWDEVIKEKLKTEKYIKFGKWINKKYEEGIIFPNKEYMLRCFKETPLETVKVVIIGKEPYYYENQANGLAFGTNLDILPKNLQLIKESYDFNNFEPTLQYLANQGVLLLNAALTVEKAKEDKKISSHLVYWHDFTKHIITTLCEEHKFLVYVFIGDAAYGFAKYVDYKENFIIKTVHPSHSAITKEIWPHGHIFSKINAYLKNKEIEQIQW